MYNEKTSTKTFFYTLRVIHAAFVVVLVLFLSITFYLNASRVTDDNSIKDIWMWILLLFVSAGMGLSFWIYRLRIREARKLDSFQLRLAAFQTAFVIRWAILDSSALMAIVAYSITGYSIYFFATVLVIAFLVWSRATKQKLISDMRLNHIERMLIEQSNR